MRVQTNKQTNNELANFSKRVSICVFRLQNCRYVNLYYTLYTTAQTLTLKQKEIAGSLHLFFDVSLKT